MAPKTPDDCVESAGGVEPRGGSDGGETSVRERRQTYLLTLSDTLGALSDPVQIEDAAMRMLGEHLGADRVFYAEIDEAADAYVVRSNHVRNVPPLTGTFRLSAVKRTAELAVSGRFVVIDDVGSDPRLSEVERAAYRARGTAAAIGVPLVKNGRWTAGVGVHQATPRRWTDHEIDLVRETAERVWPAVERAQAEAALAESEERFRTLANAIDDVVYLTDLDAGRLLYLSPAYERVWGRPIAELMADLSGFIDAVHADDRSIVERGQAIQAAGGAVTSEYRIRRPDGEVRWIFDRCFPASGQAGTRRSAGIAIDITERKRAEERLQESEALLAAVFESLPVGVGFSSVDGRLLLANHEMQRYLPSGLIPSADPQRADRWRGHDARGAPLTPAELPGARALRGEKVTPGEELLYRLDDGSELWTRVAAVPLRDARGEIKGQVAVVTDIDAFKRVTDALLASEERLRHFGDASQSVLWIRDRETLHWSYLTPAFETIYGLSRDEALRGDNFRSWIDLIVPEDRSRARAMIERAAAGEHVSFEYRIRRPVDGALRWLRNTDFPMRDAQGRVEAIGGIGEDITSLKEAEERLRSSEERLRLALGAARQATWDWNIATDEVQWSDEHFPLQGYRVGEVEPSYEAWAARVHPDDRAATEGAIRAAMDGRHLYRAKFRSLHPNGRVVWLSAFGTFFYDDDRPVRMIGVMHDVTEQQEWEGRLELLVSELQHRTRNLLGVVRSIADKTMRRSETLDEFQESFSHRLDALGRVQGLLARVDEGNRITFDELVKTELNAMEGTSERITLSGPSGVRLRSATVQTLALALHELATNAVKYGALGQEGGRLEISWTLERRGKEAPWLHILWRESGVVIGQPGRAATGTGQGRELIERALPYQLDAKTTYEIGPDGVVCTIAVRVSKSTRS